MKYASLLTIGGLLATSSGWAAGKKRSAPTPAPASFEVATPVRHVVLRPVVTQPFTLPNGAAIDLTADLHAILQTVVTETPTLAPTDFVTPPDSCTVRLEIRSNVSTVELLVSEFGLKFGYTPTGPVGGGLTGATGELNVKTGVIAMDFSIWECVGNHCVSVAAATASKKTSRTEAGIRVDFATIGTGAGFVTQTAFGAVFRDLMRQGVGQISTSARLHELAWNAMVRDYDPSTGQILFDRGASDRIKAGQDFVVYEGVPSDGRCGAFRPLAYLRTDRVDTESTLATVTQSLDPRPIKVGDLVLVRMK